jgi:DedD protein
VHSQVKERIVGAAVLVALAVWIIPWVLDGPDEPAVESEPAAELNLPPGDDSPPIRTETVELERPGPAAVRSPAPPEPSAEAPASPESEAAVADAVAPATRIAPPEPTPTPPPAAPVAASPAPAANAANGGWAVQVGAFSDRANATRQAERVSDFGFTAGVSEFRSNGAPMYRVRVGGFASREQAEVALSSLSAHGFVPRVISPE